ncbi:MAG: phage holin family protein, partial [Flavobacteriales bacterium]|nr:phage holin family protein [Flavobacteriales bacterium]
MNWLVKVILSAVAVLFSAYLIPGIHVDTFFTAMVVALVLSIINLFFRPLFVLLTLPITLVTFGLFLIAINAFMIMLAGSFVDGFHVSGFWSALIFSFVLSFLQSV